MARRGDGDCKLTERPDVHAFVLMRSWRHLSSTVSALFAGHPQIRVLVDRRYWERRQKSCRVHEERRWEGERRGSPSVDTEGG